MSESDLPDDILLRESGPENFSATDPGPPRAPITRWLHARLEQVRAETLAGTSGWHAVMSRPVMGDKKQPLKAQRDKLRKSHKVGDGWSFRVLTEWGGEDGTQHFHTLWAHYDPAGAARVGASGKVPGVEGSGEPEGRPARGTDGPAPVRTPQRLAPPPAPHPAALRAPVPTRVPPVPPGGLGGTMPGMDWANDPDEMPTREVGE